ncbi:ATP synthase F1 subunit gamma [Clostridium aminobutyricum]|uniref:ATP synthase gamma chain n=1 Tax=Clostridium aminobutyricum TaxID=33953 RepID=A0A939IIZ2_CLOAM|nr:ATP synthase F1 subunit gamma [Clostridium aminobutyricum]MBN7773068.1 ATP synthase F1 subunit gamma [Clostridium aminobutyricum]
MASSNMQDIKRRMKSVTSIEHVTNAMKLVSAAKLRKAKATFEKTTEYFHYITDSIDEIFNNTKSVPKQYLRGSREIKKTCYIIITSCRGFCGGFNSNIIKRSEAEMGGDREKAVIVAIGSRGNEYFGKRGYNILSEYCAPPEDISFLETREISDSIIDLYNAGEIDEVVLIYTTFINSLQQEAKTVTLLPIDPREDREIMKNSKQVEYEPSVEEVFNYLIPKYVEIMVYGAIVESATCEHAARRMAMENATDNARDMLGKLSLYYNRARQSAITNEIIEIVAGSEAQQ